MLETRMSLPNYNPSHKHGKICKPYNSVLGEFFLAHWDVIPVSYPSDDKTLPPIQHLYILGPPHEAEKVEKDKRISIAAPEKIEKNSLLSKSSTRSYSPSPSLSVVEQNLAAGMSDLSLAAPSERSLVEGSSVSSADVSIPERLRVLFLCEQISHHPPISAFHYAVPSRGITASGVDQIFARVSGTSVKVGPGAKNKGICVQINDGPGRGESYRITHPAASVNGILTGKFYATVSDSSIITIKGGKDWRVVLEYKDEVTESFILKVMCVH